MTTLEFLQRSKGTALHHKKKIILTPFSTNAIELKLNTINSPEIITKTLLIINTHFREICYGLGPALLS